MKWISIAVAGAVVLIAVVIMATGGAAERAECERIVADGQRCAQCVCGDKAEVRRAAQCIDESCTCQRTKVQDWKLQRVKYHYCEIRY